MAMVDVKYTKTRKEGNKPPVRTTEEIPMPIFGNLEILPPYGQQIVIPLKETDLRDSTAKNYYGDVTVPFTFWPQNKFKGFAILSYAVTRKVVPMGN